MKERIGIMGCGWLGFPLAKRLAASGYTVCGTTTTKGNLDILKSEGISPFYVELFEGGVKGQLIPFLKDIDMLVINVPPGRKGAAGAYLKKMAQLHEAIRIMHISRILFVSSTSVYGDIQGEVTEKTTPKPATATAKDLWAVERLFMEDPLLKTTTVRFGGLIGPDRHPVTFLSGQKNLKNGDDIINLIHLEDCLLLLEAIIANEWWGVLYNGVYPYHPTKRTYYTTEARKRGLAVPEYLKGYAGKTGKLVMAKALEEAGFHFSKPIDSV